MSLVRFAGIAGALVLAACGGAGDSTVGDSSWTALDEANVDAQPAQVCTPGSPDPRACDPADTKKTTVCHIPPGNPANEHTICVGDPAVKAHLAHGDKLGSCCAGKTPPPGPANDMGGGGNSGNGGGGNGGGGGGTGGSGGSGGGNPGFPDMSTGGGPIG